MLPTLAALALVSRSPRARVTTTPRIRAQLSSAPSLVEAQLAPPTPSTTEAQMLASTLKSFGGLGDPVLAKMSPFERYSKDLPASLAFRPTTITAMVQGRGGFIDPKVLEGGLKPSEMGVMMQNGKLTRMNRPRISGGSEWQTSAERLSAWRTYPNSEKIHL